VNLKKFLARVLTHVIESNTYLLLSRLTDHITLASFKALRGPNQPLMRYSVIVPTIGSGNLGDQAMFDAYLSNVRGEIVAVVNSSADLRIPEQEKNRVSVVPLRGLVSGWPVGRIRSRFKFLELLKNASSLSVVGADIMDGGYSRRDSILRSQLLMMAGGLQVPSQVLGFSWNGNPNASAQRVLERVSKRAILNVRDPLSFDRIQNTACENTVLTADTVFALQSNVRPVDDAKEWLDKKISEGLKIAIINTSGLLARRIDLGSEYVSITETLLSQGFAVAVLPHVIRKGDDDLVPARQLKAAFSQEDVLLVDRLWAPENVAWLASQSEIVVTGRMHLAILALGQGTPAITLATQGKVEGMLKIFGLHKYAVVPEHGMASKVVELLDSIRGDESARPDAILRKLEFVAADARKNFDLAARFPARIP
jgi:colanic acid/amylovoran biosynthesis protein